MRSIWAEKTGWSATSVREESSERSIGQQEGNDTMAKDGTGMQELFARVRARLRAGVGEDVFNSWFVRLELEEIVDDKAHLSIPTRFLCSWIQSNYADKILDIFKSERPEIARLHFTVRVNGQARPRLEKPAEIAVEPEAEPAPQSKPQRDVAAPRGDALSG